jgi:carboxymethylenebutenolidase
MDSALGRSPAESGREAELHGEELESHNTIIGMFGHMTIATDAVSTARQKKLMVYSGDHVDISVCITKDELVRLWEEHTAHEFATREPAATWETMVKDACGNHIPVLTGGYGKPALAEFSTERFVPNMPPHTIETPVWRTVGEDQLVAAMIYSFNHTQEMPWMLPGGPTGRRVEVPLVAIVTLRDGTLAREHIDWDQALILKQIGLLTDESWPVRGAETARKVLNPSYQR